MTLKSSGCKIETGWYRPFLTPVYVITLTALRPIIVGCPYVKIIHQNTPWKLIIDLRTKKKTPTVFYKKNVLKKWKEAGQYNAIDIT